MSETIKVVCYKFRTRPLPGDVFVVEGLSMTATVFAFEGEFYRLD